MAMHFECQESCGGKCCTARWDGKADFVFLTKKDIFNLERFLNKKRYEFASCGEFENTRFTNQKSRQWFLTGTEKVCPFLKEGKCSVYEARPTQCRTFPFWPENMSMQQWKKLSDYCPGIGKGDEVTHRDLADQISADEELRGL